jgi:hypothetical protein
MTTLKQLYRWNAAIVLAAAVGFAGLSSSCKSSDAIEAVPGDGGLESAAVAAVDESGVDRAARVSLVEGTVAAREVGAEEWETLDTNAALFEDYEISTEDDGRAELTLGDAKYIRLADGADVTLSRFEPEYAQLEVTDGTVFLALDQYANDEYYEISAPGGALVPREAGSYRVDVLPDGTTRVTVLRGTALINTPEGSFTASAGDVVNLGYEQANVEVISGGETDYRDAYYDWSHERDVYYTSYYDQSYPAPIRAFEGRNDIYGLIGLAAFGVWQALDDDDDVYVWIPNDARDRNWSPYSAGYWDYSPRVGWNWVSSEPWGWAPYHYGRWDYNDRYGWNWAPYVDDRVVGVSLWRTERYVWRPAQVYFYQPPQANYYAYVPLAPGEPYFPYSATFATVQSNPRYVDFRPRHLRERRGIFVVSPEELELRRAGRRADRDVLARLDGNGINDVQFARLPNPQRVVAERKLARIERRENARAQRNVVVTERSIERQQKRQERATARVAEREQRQVARNEQRQVRKAQNREIQVERRARRADDQVRVKAERQQRAERQLQRRAERQKVDRQAPQVRADRKAERQQQRAVQPDAPKQQRRVERPQKRANQPRAEQRFERQQRVVQPRAERRAERQLQRAAQPRAERQAARQVTRQAASQNRAERRAERQQQRAAQPKVERVRRNKP